MRPAPDFVRPAQLQKPHGVTHCFGNLCRPPILRGFVTATLALAVYAACAGRAVAAEAQPTREEAQRILSPRPRPAAQAPPAPATSTHWSIVLAAFHEGTDTERQAAADTALAKLRTVPGYEGITTSLRPKGVLITLGAFANPTDPEAQAALKRVRATVIEGQTPFAGAFLLPPADAANLGSRPEHNLLSARAQYGKKAAGTLQVAVYGRRDLDKPTETDLADARRAAEQAAATLRREGELAFYYHGVKLSMVTVGVFSDAELKPGASPALDALKKRYPHNLYNGTGIRETTRPREGGGAAGGGPKPGKDLGLQKSEIVAIPER